MRWQAVIRGLSYDADTDLMTPYEDRVTCKAPDEATARLMFKDALVSDRERVTDFGPGGDGEDITPQEG